MCVCVCVCVLAGRLSDDIRERVWPDNCNYISCGMLFTSLALTQDRFIKSAIKTPS